MTEPWKFVVANDPEKAREVIDAASDFDLRLDDTREPVAGSVTLASLNAEIADPLEYVVANQLCPWFRTMTNGVARIAGSGDDATAKTGQYTGNHYTNAEEPVTGVRINALSSGSYVTIGGGSAAANAATQIEFYTAADNVTLNGTRRGYIGSDGKWHLEAQLLTLASDTSGSGFVLPHGTAPTSPVNGAVWTTTSALYYQLNGTTYSAAPLDSTNNCRADQFIAAKQSTVTAAGTTTLTNSNTAIQVFTGTTTQTIKLATTSVVMGQVTTIINQSTGALTVQSSNGSTIGSGIAEASASAPLAKLYMSLVDTPTTAAHWLEL